MSKGKIAAITLAGIAVAAPAPFKEGGLEGFLKGLGGGVDDAVGAEGR